MITIIDDIFGGILVRVSQQSLTTFLWQRQTSLRGVMSNRQRRLFMHYARKFGARAPAKGISEHRMLPLSGDIS